MDLQKTSLFFGIVTFIIFSGILILYVIKKETNYPDSTPKTDKPPINNKENCINRSQCARNDGYFLDGAGDGLKRCRCH